VAAAKWPHLVLLLIPRLEAELDEQPFRPCHWQLRGSFQSTTTSPR
jgi:hypothetical protein